MTGSEPEDMQPWLRQRLASISAEQPCRTAGIACTICTAPVAGYPLCTHCNRNRQSEHVRSFADLVMPLAYAWEGRSQLGKDVYSYKREAGPRATNSLGNLAALLLSFSTNHAACPGRRVGAPVTTRAVMPSLRGNSGTPLARLATLLPDGWSTVRLEPTGTYGDDGRRLDPAHFRVPDPGPVRRAHVLLLEDTWVTGGHSQSATVALKIAGAAQVTVLPVCRLLRPGWPANEAYKGSRHRRAWTEGICPVTGGRCP